MRRPRLVLIFAIALLGAVAEAAERGPSPADWQWVDDAWHRTLDTVMPVDTHSLVTFRSRAGLLGYSPGSDFDDHERYFDIRQVLPGGLPPLTLVATLVAPVGTSFHEQLMTMHLDNPSTAPEELQARLSMLRSEMTEKECPALRSGIKKLGKVRVNVPSLNIIALDAELKEIHVRTGMGEIYARLTEDNEPLVRWAVEMFHVLHRCARVKDKVQ
jgi:hypothetical protein